MDAIVLFNNLPECIQILVTNYDPLAIFHLPLSDIIKYNWYKLAKINLGLEYTPETCPETDIIRLYYENCKIERSKISFCATHTMIFHDGKLMGSGGNSEGELGTEDYNWRCSYDEIKDIPKDIEEVICGPYITIIRLTDGTLMIAGMPYIEQIGRIQNRFTKLEGVPRKIVEIKLGYVHIMIRLTDGTVMGCGSNVYGQLGLGDIFSRSKFEIITGLPKNIVQIECGTDCTILRLTDGTIMGCGYYPSGPISYAVENKLKFEKIPGLPRIQKIHCRGRHTVLESIDGSLLVSGNVQRGKLADQQFEIISRFTEISNLSGIKKVICTHSWIFFLLNDRTLVTCGLAIKSPNGIMKKILSLLPNVFRQKSEDNFILEKVLSLPRDFSNIYPRGDRLVVTFLDGTWHYFGIYYGKPVSGPRELLLPGVRGLVI